MADLPDQTDQTLVLDVPAVVAGPPTPPEDVKREAGFRRPPRTPKGTRWGGRKKGSVNLRTLKIRDVSRELFDDPTFQRNLRRAFKNLTLDPVLVRTFLAYGFGRPPEKIELTGADGGPLQAQVIIMLPDNGRERRK